MYDLVIKGGRLLDPAQGIDGAFDVAFEDKTVAAIAPAIASDQAREVISAAGLLVVPGLIDLHTHVWWGGSSLSVRPEPVARRSGATTLVDAGSAGRLELRHIVKGGRLWHSPESGAGRA
jgi:dihydroorotase